MRIKDFFHDNSPDDISGVLVIYPSVVPEEIVTPCNATDRREILAKHHATKQFDYIAGYFNAINSIADSLRGRPTQATDDSTVYPMSFLVRHAIELSLKYCLNNILTHFKVCESLPGDARHAATISYKSISQHGLMPILADIIKLRSFPSHHHSIRLNALGEALMDFDSIDPEYTAFRYDFTRDDRPQKLHDRQRYIDIDGLAAWARNICRQIADECESEDLMLCSSGMYSKHAMISMDKMVAALREINNWFAQNSKSEPNTTKNDHSALTPEGLTAAIADLRIRDALAKQLMESVKKETIKYAVLGFYTVTNRCLMTDRTCKNLLGTEQVSANHLNDILMRKSHDLSYELGQLEGILARVKETHRIRPFLT